MRREKIQLPPASERPTLCFDSAEQAWFWFCQCHVARREGARPDSTAPRFTRPCDPDDIHVAVVSLRRRRVIGPLHLKVLERYGLAMRPPDSRTREQEGDWHRWCEALDRLAPELVRKGILAS